MNEALETERLIHLYCVNCGYLNPPDAEECHRCGAASKRIEGLASEKGPWLVFYNKYGVEVGRG